MVKGCRFTLKLNVAIRTSEDRFNNLKDLLLCLLAQNTQDFSVTICCEKIFINKIQDYLEIFDPSFKSRLTIVEGEKSRTKKIETLIRVCQADYINFVDDDDHLTHNHIESFKKIKDSDIKINKAVRRDYNFPNSNSRIEAIYKTHYPRLYYFFDNQWPFGSIAINVRKLRQIDLKFHKNIQFLEDWYIIQELLLAGASYCYGQETTFIYNEKKSKDKEEQFKLSNAKNFNQETIRSKLEVLFSSMETHSIVREFDVMVRLLIEERNNFGLVAHQLREEINLREMQDRLRASEKLYKILIRFREIKRKFKVL